jgi:putative PEP-CTERM system histidine kinase
VLMNLERTLRASSGSVRWRVKFMTLGLGAVFAVQVYTVSQTLLFRAVQTNLQVVYPAALVVAALLMTVALVRSRGLTVDIYMSHTVVFNSLTVLFAGIYLLAAGLVARGVAARSGAGAVPWATFVVFVALVALAALLLSDELRHKARWFVSRHLERPRYDYRKEWMDFTRSTASLVDLRALCAAVARRMSETLGVRSVTLWILDDGREGLRFGGSTSFSESEARALQLQGEAVSEFVRWGLERPLPWDILDSAFPHAASDFLRDVRYCVSLTAGGECLGFLTVSDRVGEEPLALQDLDLLKTLADQTAAGILNLRLSQRLLRAKEMEAFQTLSAFFIHDLKNLASKLSLTLQNAPAYYDDPGFREDMLALMARSVSKMNEMCGKLSPLSRKLEINLERADLNAVVREAAAGLEGGSRTSLVLDLHPDPVATALDAEQMQKVVLNLLLNAQEAVSANPAVDGHGKIHVTTRPAGAWAELSVSDNGCGMKREFVAQYLFQPFQSTKSRGLGIGLFHSKKIVEAHKGRIEVLSEEGQGSTFRVLLPLTAE